MPNKFTYPPKIIRRDIFKTASASLLGLTGIVSGNASSEASQNTAVNTQEFNRLIKTPLDYGAVGDGKADDTRHVQAALNDGPCLIERPYAVTGITANNYLTMIGQGRLIFIGQQNETCLKVSSNFGDLHVDGNSSDCTGVSIMKNDISGHSILIENITASPSSSTSIYGLRVNANNFHLERVRTYNTNNTGKSNGSFPQAIGIVGNSDNTSINDIYCEKGACAVAFGKSTGKTFIGKLRSRNMTDNGVYGLGGDNYIDSFIYEGIEEAYVAHGGDHNIGIITVIGRCIGALELGSANKVNVGEICITDGGTGNTCMKPVLTRSNAKSIGSVWIGTIKGHLKSANGVINVNNANTEFLQIDHINIILDYDNKLMPTLNAWFDITGVKQYTIGPSTIRIRDIHDTITSSTIFSCKIPRPDKESIIENLDIYFETAAGDQHPKAQCRIGSQYNNLRIKGAVWQTNIGPYAREATFLEGAMRDAASSIPEGGYWRKGQILWNTNGGNRSFGFLCTKSGEPGNWITL
ncbi:MAG: hypothetical protein H6912_01260 [Kordiimonadaceae bacterium]|nr:hypothetical protein [Kordiimonadaceae bacterium]